MFSISACDTVVTLVTSSSLGAGSSLVMCNKGQISKIEMRNKGFKLKLRRPPPRDERVPENINYVYDTGVGYTWNQELELVEYVDVPKYTTTCGMASCHTSTTARVTRTRCSHSAHAAQTLCCNRRQAR